MERWRKPAVVLDVEEDPLQVVDMAGRSFGNVRITVDADTAERMRLGYMCANCQECFEIPWPEVCNFCGVFVREQQADFFARQYRGVEQLKGGFDYDEEMEHVREYEERRAKGEVE